MSRPSTPTPTTGGGQRRLPAAVTAFGASSVSRSNMPAVSPIHSSLATTNAHNHGAGVSSKAAAAAAASTTTAASRSFSQHMADHSVSRAAATNPSLAAGTAPLDGDAAQRSFRANMATGNVSSALNQSTFGGGGGGGGGGSAAAPIITSAAARADALEAELERCKRRNAQLETEMVDARREQHQRKLEREQERIAQAQRHLQELEIEKDRANQQRDEDERRTAGQIGQERRRTEEISQRCKSLEDSLGRMQNIVAEKDAALENVTKVASEAEIRLSDQVREMQTMVRTYEAKMQAMNDVVDSRGHEIDAAQQSTREAEKLQETLRRQIRELEERRADLQADNGKLDVQLQSAKNETRLLASELQDERERRQREQHALVESGERQRDEMRALDVAISELREEVRRKNKEIHERELELTTMRATSGEMRSEVERLGRDVQRWETRAEENGAEYHQAVMAKNDVEASLAQAQTDLRESDVRQAEAAELITRLREHIAELKDELGKATAMTESYKSQLSSVDFAHQQLRSQSAMIERCETDLEAREKKIRELGAELHEAEQKGAMAQELLGHVKQLETDLQGKADFADTILARLESVKQAYDGARDEIAAKEQQIERLSIRIQEFEGALRERDDRVYALERDVSAKQILESNCAQLEATVAARTRELEKSFEEIALLKHRMLDLDQHLAKAQDYEVTIKRLETERQVAANERELLQAQLGERDGEIRDLRITLEERSTEVEGKNVELARAKRELESARRVEIERAALKDRVAQLELNVQEGLSQLRGLQSQNEGLHADLTQAQQQCSAAKVATHEAREKLENTKRALDEAQIDNGRLNVSVDATRRDIDKATLERNNAVHRGNQLGAQVDALRGELNEVVARESKAAAAVESLTAELRQKQHTAEDYARQLTEVRRQLAQREGTIGQLEEDNSALRSQVAKISVMEGKVVALERLVTDKEGEIDRMTLHSRAQQDQLTGMSSELSQAERQVRAAQDVRRKAAALQDELDTAADEVSALKQTIAERERANAAMQNQIKDLGADIEALRKRERTEAGAREQLEAEVRRLKICEGESQGLVQVMRGKDQDIETLRGQNSALHQKIAEMDETLNRNQRVLHENAVLEARMKSRDETVAALEKEMSQRALHNRELTTEVESLTQALRKLQSTSDALKESRDITERENRGLRDRVEFLTRNTKEDTVTAAAEMEAARAAANDAKRELVEAREKLQQLTLLNARQNEQLAAAESRFDVLNRELASQKAEFSSMKIAFDERGQALERASDQITDEKRRAQSASEVVSTLQQSANQQALRSADERGESSKTIDRLERAVDELKSQLNQRNAALNERGRTLSMLEERLRDTEADLRRVSEQRSAVQLRVQGLEDDIAVLQRSNDMAAARRKAAELSLTEADDKLQEQTSKLRDADRISSFERQTHADRETALRREADRLAASERSLRTRQADLEVALDEARHTPVRSPGGASSAGRGPRQY